MRTDIDREGLLDRLIASGVREFRILRPGLAVEESPDQVAQAAIMGALRALRAMTADERAVLFVGED